MLHARPLRICLPRIRPLLAPALAAALLLPSLALGQPQAPLPGQLGQPEQGPTTQGPTTAGPTTPQQAGQLGQPAAAPAAPGPPFRLSEVEQEFVDQILVMWENNSQQVKTFTCNFERWEYDPVFGPGSKIPMIKSTGRLSYQKPDKGSFKIEEIRRWNAQAADGKGDWVHQKDEVGEHWVCDGLSVYEYNHLKKQLVVQPLPPEMQGKSIVDGPLPFLFGAEAEKLKRRYWIHSPESDAESIRLTAYPRTQADAANYDHVDILLVRKTMMPEAIQVTMPNKRNQAFYRFEKPAVNDAMEKLFGFFKTPRTPLGWKKVVLDAPPTSPQAAAPEDTTTR
ncbi:MAG: TIGR03009 domain-containing protein [Planctomycetota bacterium]